MIEDSRYSPREEGMGLVCLEGERACPPEDVGGVPGYDVFCSALKDPEHEDHEFFKTWSGGDYDSERFEIDTVNWVLMRYLRWSRDRYQNWGAGE